MTLDSRNLPSVLVSLLPMAEKWGVGDDFEREEMLRDATKEELEALVHSIDDISDDDLYGWLAGSEADNPHPTAEYIAITCLTMAIDSASVKLKKINITE